MDKTPNVAMRGQPRCTEPIVSVESSNAETTALLKKHLNQVSSTGAPLPSADDMKFQNCTVGCCKEESKATCSSSEPEAESAEIAPTRACESVEETSETSEEAHLALQRKLIQAVSPTVEMGHSVTYSVMLSDAAVLSATDFSHQLEVQIAEAEDDGEIKTCSILLDRGDLKVLRDAIDRVLKI